MIKTIKYNKNQIKHKTKTNSNDQIKFDLSKKKIILPSLSSRTLRKYNTTYIKFLNNDIWFLRASCVFFTQIFEKHCSSARLIHSRARSVIIHCTLLLYFSILLYTISKQCDNGVSERGSTLRKMALSEKAIREVWRKIRDEVKF